MDGWKPSFLLERPIFRGELLVSGSVFFSVHDWSILIASEDKQSNPMGAIYLQ